MNYEKQQQQWAKRRALIVKLHRSGKYNYSDIARMMDPPISPQRVRALLLKEGEIQVGGGRA